MLVRKIEKNKKTIALIISQKLEKEGTNFFTDKSNPLQVGILKNKKGVKVQAHIHERSKRAINETQEIFIIEKGKVRVNFYDDKRQKIKSAILTAGDTVLLISGGHGLDLLEDSKILLIKQGPYHSIKEDKIRF